MHPRQSCKRRLPNRDRHCSIDRALAVTGCRPLGPGKAHRLDVERKFSERESAARLRREVHEPVWSSASCYGKGFPATSSIGPSSKMLSADCFACSNDAKVASRKETSP